MAVIFRSDGLAYKNLGNLYAAAGRQGPRAVRRAVRDELGSQHRISRRINQRITGKVISLGSLAEYHIEAKGRIALKHFKTVQSRAGVAVPGVKADYILGAADLARAFEGTTGHAGTKGDRKKRRVTLGGRIVIADRGQRRGKGEGKGKGSRLRTVAGVSIPRVFISSRSRSEFMSEAQNLPKVLSRILFAAITGALRSHRGAWRSGAAGQK